MKNRLGALAIAALLAGCSGQGDETKSGVLQGPSQSSVDPQTADPATNGLAALSQDKARTLGSAPDKGELFTYDDKVGIKHQGAYTLRPVRLSEEHAFRGVATGLMTLPAPDGSEIRIRYERHEESPDGNWSWIGKVIGGDAAQEAIFTFGQEAVFGSIPQAAGPALRLTTKGGIAYLMEADPTRLKKGYRAGGDTMTRTQSASSSPGSDNALVAMAKARAGLLTKADMSTKAFTSANTIDLAVGYSNGFVTARGGAGAAATRLSFLATVANQALLNSNINARVRIVGTVQVTYADNTDNGLALEQLTGHDGTNPVTPPAALVPLRTARDQYGADLVTLIRDFQPQNNGCGIAWLNGANGANITTAADAPFGYSVVSDGEYDEGGNTYFCEDITMVHEMAHNMGSAHDVANADGVPGRYPYSYGYKTAVALGNFFTVMAYGDDNQQLYRLFSNPDITTCGGFACGAANAADNARSLRQTIPVVSTFRGTIVPLLAAPRNDFNGDGKSDLVFRNASSGLEEWWEMNGNTVTTKRQQGAASAYRLAATGDFNGDGKTDQIWDNPTTRRFYIYTSTGTAFTTYLFPTAYGAGWTLAGAADINGDSRADLIFRNASTGLFEWWEMNGNAVTTTRQQGAAGAYQLAAIGDFNGDSRADLVWNNPSTGRFYIFTSTGTSFTTYLFPTAYGAGWSMAGAGDISGDGKYDLIFRNPTSQLIEWWEMNGNAVTIKRRQGASSAYRLAVISDFNGDGRADLIWDNPSIHRFYIFTSNGTTFSTFLFPTAYGTAWTIESGGP